MIQMVVRQWLWLPVALLLYQSFFLAHYGLSLDDGGYIYGLAYRILLGQELYTDFLYARPPLSPYLAAFWLDVLPEDGAYYLSKVVTLCKTMGYSLMAVLLLGRFIAVDRILPLGVGIALVEILNVHFIDFFWHTGDGVFFAVAAMFTLFTRRNPSRAQLIAAACFILISMASKQSFYPLPILLLLITWRMYGWYSFVALLTWLVVTFNLLFFGYGYLHPESLTAFLQIKQSRSQLWPFMDAGVVIYIERLFELTAILLLPVLSIGYRRMALQYANGCYKALFRRGSLLWSKAYLLLFAVAVGINTYFGAEGIFRANVLYHPPLSAGLASAVLLILGGWYATPKRKDLVPLYLVYGGLLGIAWMSSLSWGMKSPAFLSGVIILFHLGYIRIQSGKKVSPWLYGPLFVLLLINVTFEKIGALGSEAKEVGTYSKKLEGTTLGNWRVHARMLYVMDQVKRCPQGYEVIPGFTGVHWWDESVPLTSLDWASRAEMMNQEERYYAEAEKVSCIIYDPFYPLWDDEVFNLDTRRVNSVTPPDIHDVKSGRKEVGRLVRWIDLNQ